MKKSSIRWRWPSAIATTISISCDDSQPNSTITRSAWRVSTRSCASAQPNVSCVTSCRFLTILSAHSRRLKPPRTMPSPMAWHWSIVHSGRCSSAKVWPSSTRRARCSIHTVTRPCCLSRRMPLMAPSCRCSKRASCLVIACCDPPVWWLPEAHPERRPRHDRRCPSGRCREGHHRHLLVRRPARMGWYGRGRFEW